MEDWRKQFNRDLVTLGMAIYHKGVDGKIRSVDPLSEEGEMVINKINKIEEAGKEVDRLFNFYEVTSTPPICND